MAELPLQPGDALVLVDVQNDFLPGGSLPVSDGDEILEPLNELIERFETAWLPIVATRDWHPANHVSFAERGGPWPPHCVQGTEGAQFHEDLRLPSETIVISKADTPDKDAYSGFEGTDLHERLQALGVKRLFVGGLATDYCVLNTVLDASKLGYDVVVLHDTVRAVNVEPHHGDEAMGAMADAGARHAHSSHLAD